MVGVVQEFFIFDRQGACLFHLNFGNPSNLLPDVTDEKNQGRYKLVIGLLFSLKSFTRLIHGKFFHGLKSYSTLHYKLHFYEVPSGLKFVLLTVPLKYDFAPKLQELYSTIYVPLVVRNPFHEQGKPIESALFIKYVKTFLEQLK